MNDQTARDRSERPVGRPRSEAADRAILRAALDLLIEVGYQGMTIEGIAERAGVGKTTIYRRYASKEEILAAVVRTVHQDAPIPDTGKTFQDLLDVSAAFREQTVNSPAFPMLRYILSVALTDETVMLALREQVLKPRQRALRTILERGKERGEVRQELDLDFTVNVVPAMILFHVVFHFDTDVAPTLEDVERIMQLFWESVRAPDGG